MAGEQSSAFPLFFQSCGSALVVNTFIAVGVQSDEFDVLAESRHSSHFVFLGKGSNKISSSSQR
jgi:hypothetical protein